MKDEFRKKIKLVVFVIQNPKKFITAVAVILSEGPKEFNRRIKINYDKSNYSDLINIRYQNYLKKNYPTASKLKSQKNISKKFKLQPKISIILPTFNTPEKYLKDCIESVINQSYSNWELCIADDNSKSTSVRQVIESYANQDKRIRYIFLNKSQHISFTSNEAINISTGQYIGLLDHDDILWPNTLFEIVQLINKNPIAEFIYTDEDKLSSDGRAHFNPSFKPDFNPDYLRSANYIVHFAVIKKSLVDKLGGFRSKYDGAQDWDLFLRISNQTKNIFHIPKVLYSWRVSKSSTASSEKALKIKSYAFENQKKVLTDDLKLRGLNGRILPTKLLGIWRVKYEIIATPLISIIIPTKNQYKFISQCIDSVLKKTTYKNYELIIVDTGSEDKQVFKYYEKVKKLYKETKVLKWTDEFSFSKVCNFAAENSSGEYFLFLNNDTKIITDNWIQNLLEHAQRRDVGAVGCKLLYPEKTIQHAGVFLGLIDVTGKEVVGGHAFRGMSDHHPSTHLIDSIRNYSAVTAACLMISKKKFNLVNGFDPKFRIAFNDVDFCLKLLKKGFKNIYTPYSVLYHYESQSVGKPGEQKRDLSEYQKEINLMFKRWKNIINNDPNYNINLTRRSEDFSLKTENE